jgi:hypothetical protein
VRRDGSCCRELDSEFRSWQLADDGGVKRIQLRVESPGGKVSLYVCCSDRETVIVPVLKSDTRIRLVKTENHSMCITVNCKVRRLAVALYYL